MMTQSTQEKKWTVQSAREFLQKYEEDLLEEVKEFWSKYQEEADKFDSYERISAEAIQEILDTNKSDDFVNKLCYGWVDKGYRCFDHGYGAKFFNIDEESGRISRK